MAINGKQIFGIGVATAVVTSIATSVVLHNAEKVRRFRRKSKKESEKK